MFGIRSAFVGSAALALGCSVINAFDDVVEGLPEGGAGGDAGSGGVSGDGGTGGDSGAGSGGDSGSGGSGGSTGGAGGDGATKQPGLIVGFFRKANPEEYLVVTLDPWTGGELARETYTQRIMAIVYDRDRDTWFFWERGPETFAPATLHVGKFDENTGEYTETSAVSVPVPYGQALVGIVNKRIVYKSTIQTTGPQDGITILDTADPAQVKVVLSGGNQQSALPQGDVIKMLPHPNANADAVGGNITFVQQQAGTNCIPDPSWQEPDGGEGGTAPIVCPVRLLGALVNPSSTAPVYDAPSGIGALAGYVFQTGGRAGSTVDDTQFPGSDLIVFPPISPSTDPGAVVQARNYSTHALIRSHPFDEVLQPGRPDRGVGLVDATFDTCRKIVVAAELDTGLYAIPLQGGDVGHTPVPSVGNRVIFEPYTKSVLKPLESDVNPELTAYELRVTEGNPEFVQRGSAGALPWNPPTDLIPVQLAVKFPRQPPCN